MKNNHSFYDIFYQQGENPVFCYRSGNLVYEETLFQGALLSCGYNAAGYPLNVLTNFPTRLDKRHYMEPFAFNVEIDGQSVDFDLEFVDFIVEREKTCVKTVLVLESRIKPVRIKVHTILDGTQMFTRYLEIENLSDGYLNVSRLSVLSGGLETMEADRLTYSNKVEDFYSIGYFDSDSWGHEGKFAWHPLSAEVTCVDSRYNRDRFRHPLVFIRNNVMGKIWFAQIEWSGGCRFTVDYNAQPERDTTHLSFKAEIAAHNPMYVLGPHESLTSPGVHMGLVQGDIDDAVNEMHAHIRKTVLNSPEIDNSINLVGCGMGAEHDMSVETSKAFINQFAQMGGEVFIVDAGWECPPDRETEWGDFTGTNIPSPERYPNGIGEISEYCHANDMKFGLWADIESLGKLSGAYSEHPEWRAPNVFGDSTRRLIDFTNPQAAKWAEDELARIISEYKLDLLRVDNNVDYTEYYNMRDAGSRRKECLSVRHFKAVCKMYSNLKKRFPNVIFENCAGGGGRSDLAIMKAFHHTWVSDCQCAPTSVMITNGMTMALPPERVDRLFAGMNCHKFGSLDAQMRNTMLGHMSLNVIAPAAATVNTAQMEFVRHSVSVYKDFIRPFLPNCKIFHHTPETKKTLEDGFTVLEIASPDGDRGAMTVFSMAQTQKSEVKVRLKGVDVSKSYKVTLDNDRSSFVLSGRELRQNGIIVDIPSSMSSELILYEVIK
ncbi:MAG: alpha-galactosidase [Clostridia bacterium]|nr:alpha-galactosidase [Clostridia bacterium]MBQ7046506.1 alpha-galactosidase [Oscillospiraceae bacterium]